jgi:hypothetical protein
MHESKQNAKLNKFGWFLIFDNLIYHSGSDVLMMGPIGWQKVVNCLEDVEGSAKEGDHVGSLKILNLIYNKF